MIVAAARHNHRNAFYNNRSLFFEVTQELILRKLTQLNLIPDKLINETYTAIATIL